VCGRARCGWVDREEATELFKEMQLWRRCMQFHDITHGRTPTGIHDVLWVKFPRHYGEQGTLRDKKDVDERLL